MAKNEKKTNKKENSKNKKSFFKDFKAELKRVVWPTPKQLLNNTVAVITIVLITAAIVFVLDIAFEALNKQGINKIKDVIGNDNATTETVESTSEENEAEDATTENVEENQQQTSEENASE